MDEVQEIWADLGTALLRFVGSRVNDPHAAADITQDVLLRVQTHLGDLPPADNLPAWAFSVARNAVIDHYRARPLRDHADLGDVEVSSTGEDDEAQREVQRGLTRCLTRMVERLPEPYRGAVALADVDGLGQQEIADRLGLSLSGAKSRVQRGRQQLRAMFLDCCNVERDGGGIVMEYHPTKRSGRYCGEDGQPLCRP